MADEGDIQKAPSRIRIKLGGLEIEYEGNESFLKDHLPNLVELLASVSGPPDDGDDETDEEDLLEDTVAKKDKKIDLSTSTIANRLNANSGKDLVIAACAHLNLVKGHDKFTRANILAEMKTATSYYKKTYNNNLSSTLQRLVKAGDLNEIGENTYALDAKKTKSLEATLSGK